MDINRNASNQLSVDFDKIESKSYRKITKSVVKEFELEEENKLTNGLDERFQNFRLRNMVIGLEWDIWSGYTVVAQNTEAEPLVSEIGNYINENYQQAHNQKVH